MNTQEKSDVAVLLVHWRTRLARTADSHYRAADKYRSADIRLTIFNIIMAISVLFIANSDTIVNTLKDTILGAESSIDFPKALISIAGLLNVLTATYHYVRNYKELSIHHKQAAADFSNLKRKIERNLCSDTYSGTLLHSINRDYNNIGRAYPAVAHKIWFRKPIDDVFVTDDRKSKELLDKVIQDICSGGTPKP